jgi:hypothetical protein
MLVNALEDLINLHLEALDEDAGERRLVVFKASAPAAIGADLTFYDVVVLRDLELLDRTARVALVSRLACAVIVAGDLEVEDAWLPRHVRTDDVVEGIVVTLAPLARR